MKAAVIDKPGKISVRQNPDSHPGPDQVAIEAGTRGASGIVAPTSGDTA